MPRTLSLLAVALLVVAGCHPAARMPAATPAPAALTLAAPPADWNALVGQRIRIAAPLTVSGQHRLAREGELVASFDGRLFAPTERALPGAAAARLAADNARRRLRLAAAGDAVPGWPGDPPWRSGSVLEAVAGVVEADADGIRLRLDQPLRARPASRPPAPRVSGEVRLASLNLENLFNGDGRGGGFPTARGARSHAAYLRQRAGLVASLRALDPDVVALMELENDGEGPESSLAQLVAALNADGGDWRFVATGRQQAAAADAHPIRVGLVYRSGRVAAVGAPATLSGGSFGERSRVPLAQAFRAGDGPVFSVVAVHLKSKGCSGAEGGDRDQGDGQACWNPTRLDSVRRLDAWLRSDPTRSGSDHVAILGDFNAYALEDPIRELLAAGWRDALSGLAAPYTYVYDAQAGRLDYALLSPALAARLAGAAIWHSNADEAPNVGDHDDNEPESTMTPWRSSDHDPLLLGLRLRAP